MRGHGLKWWDRGQWGIKQVLDDCTILIFDRYWVSGRDLNLFLGMSRPSWNSEFSIYGLFISKTPIVTSFPWEKFENFSLFAFVKLSLLRSSWLICYFSVTRYMNSYLFICFQKAPKIGINRRENAVSGNKFDLRNLEQVFGPKRDGRTIRYNYIAIRALFDLFCVCYAHWAWIKIEI